MNLLKTAIWLLCVCIIVGCTSKYNKSRVNKLDSISHSTRTAMMPVGNNNNYLLTMNNALNEVQGVFYEYIEVVVSKSGRPFAPRALTAYMEITDGTTVVSPFQIGTSPNENELIGNFAVDAFDNLNGIVAVHFGYLGGRINFFDSVVIDDILVALPPDLDTIPATKITTTSLGN